MKNEKFIEILQEEKSIIHQNATLELKIATLQKDNFFISKGCLNIFMEMQLLIDCRYSKFDKC